MTIFDIQNVLLKMNKKGRESAKIYRESWNNKAFVRFEDGEYIKLQRAYILINEYQGFIYAATFDDITADDWVLIKGVKNELI